MKDKFAGLVVWYNPTDEEIEYTKKISQEFETFYVFDNSAKPNMAQDDVYLKYFCDCINHGLAEVYNRAIDYACKAQFEWLAIFDQDSRISTDALKQMKEICNEMDETVAIVAPRIKYRPEDATEEAGLKNKEWAINSGSFLHLRTLKTNGLKYDEAYFLDRLDRDFCKQVTNKGLKIIECSDVVMDQRLGFQVNNVDFHSPVRNYYIARNRLYYNHKFLRIPERWVYNLLQTLRHIFGIRKLDKNRKETLKMILAGINDYFKGHMGKIHSNEIDK